MSRESMKVYGQLAFIIAFLLLLVVLGRLFTGPLAFVSGMSEVTLTQWIVGALSLAGTLMLSRIIKREVIHGWLERKTGKQVPPLIGSLMSGLVIFIGICLILALVFHRDITALVATGGASLMILGIALRDIMLALFTGILLNVERPFRVGDSVRINDRLSGKVERITWRTTVLQTGNNEIVYVPNLSLSSAVILNMAQPDGRSKRTIELTIDYDTSVESAERILYAATLGATDVTQCTCNAGSLGTITSPSSNCTGAHIDGTMDTATWMTDITPRPTLATGSQPVPNSATPTRSAPAVAPAAAALLATSATAPSAPA